MSLRRFCEVAAAALLVSFGMALWGLAVVGQEARVPTHRNVAGRAGTA